MTLLQIDTVTNQASYFALKAKEMAIEYAPKVVGAILVYIIGSWIIKKIAQLLNKLFIKRNYDPSLRTFLSSLVRVALTILLMLSVFEMIGVKITAFAALLAGAGLAIGAALNGSLGNFAGGVMMLLFKPFKVGDMIEAQGQTGIVLEQGIFNTIILTADNKTVILPNGALSTGTIINYTAHGNLRVDLTMAIAPDMDIAKAREVAIAAMKEHPKVLDTPTPEVSVLKVGDGMVTLAIRPYTTQPDYWDVYFGVQELVKNAWDAHGVQGPVPHRVLIQK
ncbi:mechanosensitive ion channel family protein [Niabella sp. CJ426]|uniref:mechanosensitive ion channel family protein n=1 Tax=Niabella sp. CJ426 TaxID=3393740 RepID=UPI003D088F43